MADYKDPLISEESVNAGADAVTALANGGSLRYYDENGAGIPTSVNEALSTQVLLAQLTLANPAFGAAGAGALDPGVAAADTITSDSDANATGTANFFRVHKSNGDAIWQGTIGPTADPQTDTYDLYMNSVEIQQHAAVSCSEFYYTGQGYVAP